jgi:predicted ribosome quality control (RQC) complex YloA/Tae2 family protein
MLNNYFIMYHQAAELKALMTQAVIMHAFTRRKQVLELVLEKDGRIGVLTADVSVGKTCFFFSENDTAADGVKLFPELDGDVLVDIALAPFDRIITLHFTSGKILRLDLFGSRPNVVLIHLNGIQEFFKKRPLAEAKPERNGLLQVVKASQADPRLPKVLDTWWKAADAKELAEEAMYKPVFRLTDAGFPTVFNEERLPAADSKRFNTANGMVAYCYWQSLSMYRFSAKKAALLGWFNSTSERLERRLQEETDVLVMLEKAEKWRHRADSVLAMPQDQYDGSVSIPDIYENGQTFEVTLSYGETLYERAHEFYGKARRLEQRAEAAERLSASLNERKNVVLNLIAAVEVAQTYKELEKLEKQAGAIEEKEGSKRALPGVSVMHVSGFDVRIGKSASGNELLLHKAHKEDIWLHARGVPGSHVVIENRKREEFPPKEVLEQAARWAAWRSKARGASWVPVQVAKRKFVRKPKGAPPGTVLVQREDVLMVKPEADDSSEA